MQLWLVVFLQILCQFICMGENSNYYKLYKEINSKGKKQIKLCIWALLESIRVKCTGLQAAHIQDIQFNTSK